jgi:hypothetical protein
MLEVSPIPYAPPNVHPFSRPDDAHSPRTMLTSRAHLNTIPIVRDSCETDLTAAAKVVDGEKHLIPRQVRAQTNQRFNGGAPTKVLQFLLDAINVIIRG